MTSPCDGRRAFTLRTAASADRRVRAGLILATSLLCLSAGRAASAVVIDVALSDERVIIDDSDPRFKGAEIRAPQFCPYDTNWLCFEVRNLQAFRLYLYNRETARITEIQPGQNGGSGRIGSRSATGGNVQNTDFDWRPVADPGDGKRWFVFSSDASGAFDLWLGEAVSGTTIRIPSPTAATNENGPKWSPDGELIAYTSQGDIYLLRYVRDILDVPADTTKRLRDAPEWLVKDPGLDYEIRWYPGKKAGYLAYTHQDSATLQLRSIQIRICDILENRIDSIQDAKPGVYLRSASWNPAGRGDLAFYQTREYPDPGKEVSWGVGIAHVELKKREQGVLDLRLRRPRGPAAEFETSVQTSYDLRFGPVWTPDGSQLALTRKYEDTVQDLQDPLWLYDVRAWEFGGRYRSDVSFAPAFKLPRDVTFRGDQIAFVYVDGQNRKLLSARLRGRDFGQPKSVIEWPLVTEARVKKYDWKYIDRPGFLSKSWHWASQSLFKPNVGLNTRGVGIGVVAAIVVYAITKGGGPGPKIEPWNPPGFGKR